MFQKLLIYVGEDQTNIKYLLNVTISQCVIFFSFLARNLFLNDDELLASKEKIKSQLNDNFVLTFFQANTFA